MAPQTQLFHATALMDRPIGLERMPFEPQVDSNFLVCLAMGVFADWKGPQPGLPVPDENADVMTGEALT
jgi:hypothetical protein